VFMPIPPRAISSNTLRAVAVSHAVARGEPSAGVRVGGRGAGRARICSNFEDPYGEEGEEEERVAEGVGGGVVARVRVRGEGGVEGVRLRQGTEECEGGGGQRGEAVEDGGEEGCVCCEAIYTKI
jgi:hypothetical protein